MHWHLFCEIIGIEVGKEADFVLVDRDIMTCAESEILGAKVLRLYVSGRREV